MFFGEFRNAVLYNILVVYVAVFLHLDFRNFRFSGKDFSEILF